MKKILLGIALIFSGISYSQTASPDVIGSAGAHFAIPSMQMSWTLGETVTATVTDGTNTLTQGFHQSNLSLIGVDIVDPVAEINVFPNPITDVLTVEVSGTALNSQLLLIDGAGKTVMTDKVTALSFTIDFTTYAKGVYYLNFKNELGQILQTITLQKIN